jgi:hypothetical protein
VTSGRVVRGASLTKASLWVCGKCVSLFLSRSHFRCSYSASYSEAEKQRESSRGDASSASSRESCRGVEYSLDKRRDQATLAYTFIPYDAHTNVPHSNAKREGAS